jgi:hypothetical protein
MKVAVISPTAFLEDYAAMSNYHLVLAHVYEEDMAYREFYKRAVKSGDFVMLDNSAYELGAAVSIEKLLDVIEDLQPTALFLPDVRFDMHATLKQAESALKELSEKYSGEMMKFAVPQGKNLEEVVACYRELQQMGIDGFGLYEEIGQVAGFKNRPEFLAYMEREGLVDTNKYYHCLGMEEDTSLIKEIAKFDWVSGIDSAKPVVYGLYGIAFSEEGPMVPYPHRPEGYFGLSRTDLDFVVRWNISMLQRWAGAVGSALPRSGNPAWLKPLK